MVDIETWVFDSRKRMTQLTRTVFEEEALEVDFEGESLDPAFGRDVRVMPFDTIFLFFPEWCCEVGRKRPRIRSFSPTRAAGDGRRIAHPRNGGNLSPGMDRFAETASSFDASRSHRTS
ncbi:MAG: hypothetical protein SFX72_12555 [Isosphaeraceae bacterium]|nr:hypothetical protein [Isosphaeraceae bacterium]